MKPKGFAVDVDGTLTEDGRIDFKAMELLRWLADSGFKVILVSGRSVWELLTLASLGGLTKLVVAENGGVVALSPTKLVMLADKYEVLKGYDYLSERIEGVRLRETFPRLTELVLERTFDLSLGNRLLEEAGFELKLRDSNYAYHLESSKVDKGKGLLKALKHLGADGEEFVAIGDSDVDVDMFRVCGRSVAMENGTEGAKRAADYVAKGRGAAGLKDAVEWVLRLGA